jgi:hypothetical protein
MIHPTGIEIPSPTHSPTLEGTSIVPHPMDNQAHALLAKMEVIKPQPVPPAPVWNAQEHQCELCPIFKETLLKIQEDFQYNLNLIESRDLEISRWEARDAWWRKRWRDRYKNIFLLVHFVYSIISEGQI